MIDGFHSGDELRLLRGMLVDVLDQFSLCIRGPGYQYRTGACDGVGDGLKIVVILGRVPAPDGIRLVMDVSGRMVRMNDEFIDVRGVEMEYAGLVVVDPDDGMKMMATHEFLSKNRCCGGRLLRGFDIRANGQCDAIPVRGHMLKQDAMLGIRFVPRVLPAVFSLFGAPLLGQGRPGLSHHFSSDPPTGPRI
jgi:hypothetical protein